MSAHTRPFPYPFDPERCIGSVIEVGPCHAKINLPHAAAAEASWHHGVRLGRGEVGEFVVIEDGHNAVLGRITQIKLPERERLTVEPELGRRVETHPLGTVQLLSTLPLDGTALRGGIRQYPRLGRGVYSVHPELLKHLATVRPAHRPASHGSGTPDSVLIDLATLGEVETPVCISPERLFGRHCAVVGSTGGGKSWTVARMVEQAAHHGAKVVLVDATGEFNSLDHGTRHTRIGESPAEEPSSIECVLPYQCLKESELTALLRPSIQAQLPKLRAAIRSLKLARLVPALAPAGYIKKRDESREQFESAYRTHLAEVEDLHASFDIRSLARQLEEECHKPNYRDASRWGAFDESSFGFCISLVHRIEDVLASRPLACMFSPEGKPSIFDELDAFLASDDAVLRISLQHLAFEHDAREIVVNALGRHLLAEARKGAFRDRPLLIFLDEAHQFLDRVVGDEANRYHLDAFELIAKEGRKYCLNLCLATQRPRDIPEGVLSQMGTLVVHRLINERDREVVERASGDIDRSAAAFLPTLGPGQAVLIGADFPIPLTVQITPPQNPPVSHGPDYQRCWRRPAAARQVTPVPVQMVEIMAS